MTGGHGGPPTTAPPSESEEIAFERGLARKAAWIGALGATGLGALGRFRPALALTLGAAVAIVSTLWLSDVVTRLAALRVRAGVKAARFDWKFGLKAALRYAVVGVALYAAVRIAPTEIPWLLAGVSTVVLAAAAEAAAEVRRAARG